MRYLRILLVMAGVAVLVLAFGFFFQLSWATQLWPLPDGRLSFNFMASILSGSAVPLIWIGLSGEIGSMVGYAIGFGVMYLAMAIYAFLLYGERGALSLLMFGGVLFAFALLCAAVLLWSSRYSISDMRSTPRPVHFAFMVEVGVLVLVGILLLLTIPILPWPLKPESSIMYGWVFIGMALYFIYALLRPEWHNARGQLMGFLAYDLLLIVPLLGIYAHPKPEYLLGLIAATVIVLSTGTLAIYYLFVNKATRLWMVQREAVSTWYT